MAHWESKSCSCIRKISIGTENISHFNANNYLFVLVKATTTS
uniref:Uncharacterized protein n=1 Tax=Rhizophora mucronata TaxID=61149 RepID=A0A2P2NRR7_RHIMU